MGSGDGLASAGVADGSTDGSSVFSEADSADGSFEASPLSFSPLSSSPDVDETEERNLASSGRWTPRRSAVADESGGGRRKADVARSIVDNLSEVRGFVAAKRSMVRR